MYQLYNINSYKMFRQKKNFMYIRLAKKLRIEKGTV